MGLKTRLRAKYLRKTSCSNMQRQIFEKESARAFTAELTTKKVNGRCLS